jgi:hypothetical protein
LTASIPTPFSLAFDAWLEQHKRYIVNFRVLLDPRLNARIPGMQAQLQNTVIEQAPIVRGTYQNILTRHGVYFVIGARYIKVACLAGSSKRHGLLPRWG